MNGHHRRSFAAHQEHFDELLALGMGSEPDKTQALEGPRDQHAAFISRLCKARLSAFMVCERRPHVPLETVSFCTRYLDPGSNGWMLPDERRSELLHAQRAVLGQLKLVVPQKLPADERERGDEGRGSFGLGVN